MNLTARAFWYVMTASVVLPGAAAQPLPFFSGLGAFRGDAILPTAISADGSTVLGYVPGANGRPLLWRLEDGAQPLPDPPDGLDVRFAHDVSADGSVVVGGLYCKAGPCAFRYEVGRKYEILLVPAAAANATAVSDDGSVVLVTTAALDPIVPDSLYRWTADDVIEIEPPPGMLLLWGEDISGDGAAIVGTVPLFGLGLTAFRWTLTDGLVSLGDLSGGIWRSDAFAVSFDGSTVVGKSSSADSGADSFEAIRWTPEEGMVPLAGGPYSTALGVSSNGSVIVGDWSVEKRADAFIWDASHGMRSLRGVLEEIGLVRELKGWWLLGAIGISADGRTIVGNGRNPQGEDEAWIAHLGTPCRADWNADGDLTSADFFAFLDALFCDGKGCASADFNADDAENSQDFFDFLVAFFEGCA